MDFSVQPDDQLMPALRGFTRHAAPLKIIVKTRDEVEFTRAWIEHHAGIVGLENLLIADNASTRPEVFEIYRSYGPALNWFSFSGHHNSIHDTVYFPQLYEGLRANAQFVTFIDMDERLVSFHDGGWSADQGIAQRLASTSADMVLATWLQNAPGRDDAFVLYPQQLEWGVIFGKPILSTENRCLGTPRFHAVQYPKDHATCQGLGVLHLSHLSIEQRLRANKNKLIQRGVAKESTSYDEIAAMDTAEALPVPLVTVRCIEEIRQLLLQQSSSNDTPQANAPAEHLVELGSDHRLRYGSPDVERLMTDFLRQEHEASMSMLPVRPMYTSQGG